MRRPSIAIALTDDLSSDLPKTFRWNVERNRR